MQPFKRHSEPVQEHGGDERKVKTTELNRIADRRYHGYDYGGREIHCLLLGEYQFCERCQYWHRRR